MKRQPSTGIGKWEVWTRQKNTSKYVWGLTRMFLVTNGHSWRLLHRPENICSPSSFWLGVPKYLPVKLRAVQKYYSDWHFTEIGIDKDHVHVHMVIPPKYSVSVAVEPIKGGADQEGHEPRAAGKAFYSRQNCQGVKYLSR